MTVTTPGPRGTARALKNLVVRRPSSGGFTPHGRFAAAVLVVEDDRLTRRVLYGLLELQGYTAHAGEEQAGALPA